MFRLNYKHADEATVFRRARELVGRSLRELHGPPPLVRGKGEFGTLLEIMHFGMEPDPSPLPDFPVARRELKAVGVVRKKGRWQAKERLVHNVIDYVSLAGERDFRSSGFFAKNARTLLVAYEYLDGVDPVDLKVVTVGLVDLEWLDPVDLAMIERDWRWIRDKVVAGQANDLSEADTYFLAASVKGSKAGKELRPEPSGGLAQQRAFSFKAPFVTRLVSATFAQGEALRDVRPVGEIGEQPLITDPSLLERFRFEDLVIGRLERFEGKSVTDIHAEVGVGLNPRAKSYFADLTRRMLGVETRRIAEFEKAGVMLKTVRVGSSGRPKESMSFPRFRMKELARQSWRDSDLRETLSRRFLFAFFVDDGRTVRFSHAALWAMPESDLREVRRVWIETVRRIRRGKAKHLPGSKFSRVAHVRPHGRDSLDVDEAPDGSRYPKRSFWLNASYIGDIYVKTRPGV